MTPKHTAESLAALIKQQYEPDNAERLLDALRPLDGKLITTRLLDHLPGGRVAWHLTRHLGWTELSNKAYRQDSKGDNPQALNLIIARSEASVPLDIAHVERENAQYFKGRRERNAQRDAALADPHMLTRLSFVMNELEDLHHKLKFAVASFENFVKHGDPCEPDRYELERACGLREEKKR